MLALALALCPAPDPAPAVLPPAALHRDGDGKRESLEDLLRRVRARRAESLERLEEPVAERIRRIESIAVGGSQRELERIRDELVGLGPEAAPLLVRYIEPGPTGGDAARKRATLVADALSRVPTRAITDEVIRIARSGSKPARRNAMHVLGRSADVPRASACLADIFRNSTGELRTTAVTALARLGGAENEALLLTALEEEDTGVLRAVLRALTEVHSVAAREKVRELAGAPLTATPLVDEILDYFLGVAEAVEAVDVSALIRLAAHDAPRDSQRIRILDAIPTFEPTLSSKQKKLFDPLLSTADGDLREAAQICLALLGDRNRRRELLRRYDDLVESNDRWAKAYEKRGAIHLRLGDVKPAIKDFRQAIKLAQSQGRGIDDELYVQIARAYLLDGSVKKAHEALVEGSLTRRRLRELAQDPGFAPLRDHSRYGKIFDV